jgi:RNA polymerase sigma factor (TIGR02999 family)
LIDGTALAQRRGTSAFAWVKSCPEGRSLIIRFSLSDVTRILESIEHGDPKAAEQLLPLVYEELRKLAASKMAREAPNQTLQPTALVHEAWLRLVGNESPQFANRAHFFAAAAEAMRRILIDKARQKHAQRHGGGQQRVGLEGVAELAAPCDDDELLAVNDALDKLATQNPTEAQLVKLRYFVGMTLDEAAEALGISERTADNYWAHARAWLFREIKAQRQQ